MSTRHRRLCGLRGGSASCALQRSGRTNGQSARKSLRPTRRVSGPNADPCDLAPRSPRTSRNTGRLVRLPVSEHGGGDVWEKVNLPTAEGVDEQAPYSRIKENV